MSAPVRLAAAEGDLPMPQPTPAEPFPQPVELPGPPNIVDPTGLTFDRGDLEEPTATRTAAAGWAVTGRGITSGEHPAPDVLPKRDGLRERKAPVVVMKPFNLRALAAQGITAAEQDRRERAGAA